MGLEDLKAKLAKMRGETAPTQTPATTEEKTAAEKPAATQPPTRALLDGAKASAPADEPKPEILKTPEDTKKKLEALRAKVKKTEPATDAPKKPDVTETIVKAMVDVGGPEAMKQAIDARAEELKKKVDVVASTPGLAELAAREAAAAPHVTTTEAPGEVVKVEVRKGETAAPSGKGSRCRFLLLNAIPAVGLTATPLEVFLDPILETIRRETGKNWQMHAYREGTGMIIDGIARAAEHGLIPEVLAVDTTTALGKVAIEALMHRADVVISGRAA